MLTALSSIQKVTWFGVNIISSELLSIMCTEEVLHVSEYVAYGLW
jgi:hypothetical protein